MTSRGTPSAATKTGRALFDEQLDVSQHLGGKGGEQVDAEGLVVSSFVFRISSTIWSLLMAPAPRQPKPPASDTAATRRW